jgi:GH35 family endo-1,4-beta-xylanase
MALIYKTAGCARAITMYSPTAAICSEAYMASTVLKNALPSGTKEAENAENIKKKYSRIVAENEATGFL